VTSIVAADVRRRIPKSQIAHHVGGYTPAGELVKSVLYLLREIRHSRRCAAAKAIDGL